jgi:hypothetical protein
MLNEARKPIDRAAAKMTFLSILRSSSGVKALEGRVSARAVSHESGQGLDARNYRELLIFLAVLVPLGAQCR